MCSWTTIIPSSYNDIQTLPATSKVYMVYSPVAAMSAFSIWSVSGAAFFLSREVTRHLRHWTLICSQGVCCCVRTVEYRWDDTTTVFELFYFHDIEKQSLLKSNKQVVFFLTLMKYWIYFQRWANIVCSIVINIYGHLQLLQSSWRRGQNIFVNPQIATDIKWNVHIFL